MNTQNLRKEKAQGMVEFALVLPLLLLVMFAVIEFGRLLFTYSAVFSASREAARYGAAPEARAITSPITVIALACEAAARRISNLAGLQHGYDPTTIMAWQLLTIPPRGVAWPSTIPDVISLGDRVEVTVSTTYQPILPLVQIPPIPISSTAARTILKDISISGTPSAPMGSRNGLLPGRRIDRR